MGEQEDWYYMEEIPLTVSPIEVLAEITSTVSKNLVSIEGRTSAVMAINTIDDPDVTKTLQHTLGCIKVIRELIEKVGPYIERQTDTKSQ